MDPLRLFERRFDRANCPQNEGIRKAYVPAKTNSQQMQLQFLHQMDSMLKPIEMNSIRAVVRILTFVMMAMISSNCHSCVSAVAENNTRFIPVFFEIQQTFITPLSVVARLVFCRFSLKLTVVERSAVRVALVLLPRFCLLSFFPSLAEVESVDFLIEIKSIVRRIFYRKKSTQASLHFASPMTNHSDQRSYDS